MTEADASTSQVFDGQYFDGRTARAHAVRVAVGPTGLSIVGADGVPRADWPADQVRLGAGIRRGEPLQLRCGDSEGARLSLPAEAEAAVFRHCPKLHASAGRFRDNWKAVLFWTVGAIASVAFLLLVGVPWLATVAARNVPPSLEAQWGDDVADTIAEVFARRGGMGRAVYCDTPAGRAALDRLTERLTAGADLPLPLTVRVLDVPVTNAVALPGGHILLFAGLIDDARDGDELAGVLAHEIGHAALRHPLELVFEQVGIATLLGLLLGDVSGSTVIIAGSQLLLVSSYSRDAEREADDAAVAMLNRAGIGAESMAAFFDRLTGMDPGGDDVFAMISTHPPSAELAAAIRAESTGDGAAMSDADWQAIRSMCDL